MKVFAVSYLLLLASCASSGPDSDMSLGSPVSLQEAERKLQPHTAYSFETGRHDYGQEWADFISRLKPGDELRPYFHPRGGQGYAIIRGGQVEDVYFLVIF